MKTTGFDLAHWEYDRLLRAYARRFGRENVAVIDYGRFTRDPSAVLVELAGFLDLGPWSLSSDQLTTRMNEGESDRETRMRQRLNHFTKSELNPYPPIDIPDRVSAFVVQLCRHLQRRPLFGADFDAWVEERFSASNRRLSEEWGVTLSRSGGEP